MTGKEIVKYKYRRLAFRAVVVIAIVIGVLFVFKKGYDYFAYTNKVYYKDVLVHEYKSPFNRDLPTKQEFFKKPILKSQDKYARKRSYEIVPKDDIFVSISEVPVKSIIEITETTPGRTTVHYETYENDTIIGSSEVMDTKEALKLKVGPIETREMVEFNNKKDVYKLATNTCNEKGCKTELRSKPRLFAN